MADKKLEYEVVVKGDKAVSELKQIGEAGEKAGKQLADGFKDVGSKSEAAFDKVIGNLKQVTTESQATLAAVAKIGDKFGEGFDAQGTAQLVNSLRKAGVEFDTIEARADELAATMREIDAIRIEGPGAGLRQMGSDLDAAGGKLRNVGDEMGHVRSESDQSRSVLANMAGNTAQDLGQLGGVVGSLGVGIGQLAEYAVDGNIALSNLAKTAGPLAAVAVAGFLIQDAFKNAAETKAFNVEQAQSYADAIGEVGDSMQAVVDIAQEGLEGRIRDESILGGLLDKEKTVDLIKLLDEAGLTLGDVNDAIRSGAHDRTEFTDWLNGASPEAATLRAQFDDLAGSGETYTAVLEGVLSNTIAYTTATDDAARKTRVMVSTVESVNEQLALMRIEDDPLTVLTDGMIKFGSVMVDPMLLWRQLVADLRDGKADTINTAQALDAFAAAMHLSVPEVEALAVAQGEAAKSAGDLQVKSTDAADATEDLADASGDTASNLQGEADALQSIIDKTQEMIDSSHGLAQAQQEWDDALKAWPATVDEFNAAIDETTVGTPEHVDAINAERDAVERMTDSWTDAMELRFKNQGVEFTSLNATQQQAHALASLAATLSDDVIPSLATYYRDIFKIPAKRQTAFEMVLERGDADEIEQFITDNSGTEQLEIKVTADQAQLDATEAAIAAAAKAPPPVPITAQAHVAEAKAVIGASFGPQTVPVNADASSAKTTMDQFRRDQGNTPIYVKVVPTKSAVVTTSSKGIPRVGTSAAPTAAPSVSAFAAGDEVGITPFVGESADPAIGYATPVYYASASTMTSPQVVHNHVTVAAAVIGSRFDVERAVTKALRSAQRVNGTRN